MHHLTEEIVFLTPSCSVTLVFQGISQQQQKLQLMNSQEGTKVAAITAVFVTVHLPFGF